MAHFHPIHPNCNLTQLLIQNTNHSQCNSSSCNSEDDPFKQLSIPPSPYSDLHIAVSHLDSYSGAPIADKNDLYEIELWIQSCLRPTPTSSISPSEDSPSFIENERFLQMVLHNLRRMEETLEKKKGTIYFPKLLGTTLFDILRSPLKQATSLSNMFTSRVTLISRDNGSSYICKDLPITTLTTLTHVFKQAHQREEEILLTLKPHRGIVALHGLTALPVSTYSALLIEHAPGGNFSAILQHPPTDSRQIFNIAQQTAQALSHLHKQRIIYSNLQPEHIVIDVLGRAKLTNFSQSFAIPSQNQKDIISTGLSIATEETLSYYPPEFFPKTRPRVQGTYPISLSHNVATWQFGCTFFKALDPYHQDLASYCHGQFPPNTQNERYKLLHTFFHGHPDPQKYIDDCVDAKTEEARPMMGDASDYLGALIKRCLIVDPEQRPNMSTITEEFF